MTKKKFQKLWYNTFNNTFLREEFWLRYRDSLKTWEVCDYIKDWISTEGKEFMKQRVESKYDFVKDVPLPPLGNCEAVAPAMYYHEQDGWSEKQQGNNPMRIDNTTATAYVTTPKSDDATSREYLLSRLSLYEGWRNPKVMELSTFFNIGEDGRPATYLQLIDAIKNDKFTLDDKAVKRLKRLQEELADDGDEVDFDDYGYGPFYGIVFTDFPKSDRKGYDAAIEQFNSLIKATKDTIMVKSPDEGLSALQALEAWTPTGKAS